MALGTASLGRDLALAVGQPAAIHPDAAYLAGLLHNLGELALVHLRPDLMCEAVHAQRSAPGSDPIALQREYLGIDCWQAGEVLAFHWHLPESVQQVVAHFGGSQAQGNQQALVQVVVAARTWVKAALAGELPDIMPPDAAAAEFHRIVAAFRSRLDELGHLASMML
jgi:HD-like signal output (HDOD) protein